jgi:hypothetical protein
MIARNFIRFPDALRFQRELFHNGYKNQPRIMRAMECIFKFMPDVPQWVKDAGRKAKQLVKHWRAGQIVLNFAESTLGRFIPKGWYTNPYGKETWNGRGQVPKWLRTLARNNQGPIEVFQVREENFVPWAM